MVEIMHLLKKCPLFAGISDRDIGLCLQCSGASVVSYEKDEFIFLQTDTPKKLTILVSGSVAVYSNSASGDRNLMANFNQPGELFGEVFLFLNQEQYDYDAQALTPTQILHIPKNFLYHNCGKECMHHSQIISNMLTILAQKAYFLNRKLQILSCSTLRQKIAYVLLQNYSADGKVILSMNREELADFLNAARPSLSRELMKMQEEGLIRVDKKVIYICDFDGLTSLL